MKAILAQADHIFEYTRALRREFHRQPELGFQEFHTAEIILRELSKLEGFSIQSGIAGTGVVALLNRGSAGKTVLLRFDMDALPVKERTGVDYASQREGVMHACGHDGHLAIGLGAARLLSERRHELEGQVKFLFQPAEEGLGGALAVIKAGVLEDPQPDIVLGLHVWNEKELGWLGISDGPVMSASETFEITIKGRGGHGGMPHKAADPITAAAAVINSLQTLVAREIPPLDSAVISVCSIHGGEAHNVIPEMVSLGGTIRTFRKETRQLVVERFHQVVEGVAAAHRCAAGIKITEISPAVINHPDIAGVMRQTAKTLFPEADVDANYQTMASEDMAYLMSGLPGCYSFVGSANPQRGLIAKHHQPDFNFDEGALKTGLALLAGAVGEFLKK